MTIIGMLDLKLLVGMLGLLKATANSIQTPIYIGLFLLSCIRALAKLIAFVNEHFRGLFMVYCSRVLA